MILKECALLSDENLDPEVVAFLRGMGFDVLDVKEAILQGTSDLELLRMAFRRKRVIVTHDPDFGRLVVLESEPFVGIIFLRPGHDSAEVTIGTIKALLGKDLQVTTPFIVVTERRGDRISIRITHFGGMSG